MKTLLLSVFCFHLLFAFQKTQGQGLCPPNLDFENGDFANWELFTGHATEAPIIWNPSPLPVNGQHTIISQATAGLDPYGRFPTLCPNGSGYSVKLGNSFGGGGAERLTYTYTIPATLTVFSMIFHYAIVYDNPIDHTSEQQPRFRAVITDLSTGLVIPCVDFDFTASTAPAGFEPSPIMPTVLFKNWTPVTVNLNAYIGKTIQIEFSTNDCTFTQHFGYAYVDVNSNCNGAISGATICQGDNSITLAAPFGFKSYKWYSDNTFTTVLATTQTLPLNPAPAVGTIIPVVVEPYTGFGCKDTLYATIGIAPKPVSDAGPDITICNGVPELIGTAPTTGYIYQWTPSSNLSNPLAANPSVLTGPANPTVYTVKTTDILTGCFSTDATTISSQTIDASIPISGAKEFCDGQTSPSLSVGSGLTSIQWYNDPVPIPGATGITYTPLVSGSYWAQVKTLGCTDSTEIIQVTAHPPPISLFAPVEDTLCITDNSFDFPQQYYSSR